MGGPTASGATAARLDDVIAPKIVSRREKARLGTKPFAKPRNTSRTGRGVLASRPITIALAAVAKKYRLRTEVQRKREKQSDYQGKGPGTTSEPGPPRPWGHGERVP